MKFGIGLYKWNNSLGVILDEEYPEDFEIDDNDVNKVLMTHAIGKMEQEDFVKIYTEEKIFYSYWRHLDDERGYELLFLCLINEGSEHIPLFRFQFLTFAKEILSIPQGKQRNKRFIEKAKEFKIEDKRGKVLLLGKAATGKTSIKQVVFEGKDPEFLLKNPLKPTIILEPTIFSWLDLKIGVFDTVGQRFNEYFSNDKKKMKAFSKADFIIYIFDFNLWVNNWELIFSDVKEILKITEETSFGRRVILFLHKIDLIAENKREKLLREVENRVHSELDLKIYFTSLYPELLSNLYSAFSNILGTLSEEGKIIANLLDKMIINYPKTMVFITNKNNSIVVQSINPGFDFKIINHMHNLIANINQTFSELDAENEIKSFMISTFKNFNIIMRNLNLSDNNFKDLVIISGSLRSDQLIRLIDEIYKSMTKVLK